MKHYFKQNNWEDKDINVFSFNTKKLKRKQQHQNEEFEETTQTTISSELHEPKKLKKINKKPTTTTTTTKETIIEKKTLKKCINNDNKTNQFNNKLRETLKGGHFRYINEQLYTMKGSDAKKLFDSDNNAFESYHEGYRYQVNKWPFNPLQRLIKKIKKLPKHLIIGDFGCGDAKLAESVTNQVYSIDLLSTKPNVIACDMANTTLNTNSIDLAVYCLSLMGTNISEYLYEANRVLKLNGLLYITEIASRFDNFKEFIKYVECFGFQLQHQDQKKFFIFLEFKKLQNINKNIIQIKQQFQLKPCIYKKR